MSRRDTILSRMRALETELSEIDSFPRNEDFREGDIIAFTLTGPNHHGNAKVFLYAAIKGTDGLWSTTGPRSPKSYVWDDLISWFLTNNITEIRRMNPGDYLGRR